MIDALRVCKSRGRMSDKRLESRYPVKIGHYSSHAQLLRLLGEGRGRSLLDVGCAQGEIAAGLARQGWSVVGVEPDQGDAAVAREKGLRVVHGYLSDVLEHIDQTFHVVLYADVLEHMSDPVDALKQTNQLLNSQGMVVASIPNIAHLAVRLQLMAGSFTYTDRGPLDRTHLRFFTRRTVRRLFKDANYRVLAEQVTPAPIELAAAAVGIKRVPRAIETANWTSAVTWPSGLAYQFLLLAQPGTPEKR